jgi:DNA-binding CsgD family transcriptional regulator
VSAPSVLDLTERELEVLQMKCTTGKTAAEVAYELNIGEQTVKTHLQHAREKLGVDSTEQACFLLGEEVPDL